MFARSCRIRLLAFKLTASPPPAWASDAVARGEKAIAAARSAISKEAPEDADARTAWDEATAVVKGLVSGLEGDRGRLASAMDNLERVLAAIAETKAHPCEASYEGDARAA